MTAKHLVNRLLEEYSVGQLAKAIKMDKRNVQKLKSGESRGNPVTRRFLSVLIKSEEARRIVGL